MRLRALRPVGEPLPPLRQAPSTEQLLPRGYDMVFTQSGTAALALALRLVANRAGPDRRRVLLPAYGCPDLVAAVHFNGLEAELVDTAPDSPFMSLEQLCARLDDDVLAVVGAHFLGLAEDMAGIEAACAGRGIAVIEDSAQRVPGVGGINPVSDFVVMSFGRGKPAGALGGGALLLRRGTLDPAVIETTLDMAQSPRVPMGLMRQLYNQAIRPLAYGVVALAPGLELGVTRYKGLDAIHRMDAGRAKCARAGWGGAASSPLGLQAAYFGMIEKLPEVHNLPTVRVQADRVPLGRFPVLLAHPGRRDALLARLLDAGLGASSMYGKALADLEGMPSMHASRVSSARSFAGRLLTLPLHRDVQDADFRRIERLLGSIGRPD
ncbi:MAG: DegT/DnrJ/EryC1/StrS family aminotransferase [Wenzhouxiangellaceae bacterium]